jgi:hypothetical protein
MMAAQLIARPLSELGDENDPAFKLGVTLVYGVVAVAGNLLLFKLIYRRGFFMTAMKTTRNKWAIWLVPAAIFGLLHIMNGSVTALSIANASIAGLVWGYMFIKSGALWLSTGFHVAWNFFMGDIFGIGTFGTPTDNSVLTTQLGTNTVLTGSYGPEDSILCTLTLFLAFAATKALVKKPKLSAWTMDSGLPLSR